MRPIKRFSVNKNQSARTFRKNAGKTNPKNVRVRVMRGGWRL